MQLLLKMLLLVVAAAGPHARAASPTSQDARGALKRAVAFFSSSVAVEGGYVWRYSADLTKREGEGKVALTTVWLQPPATPSVGEAYLDAHAWSGELLCLEAATQTARLLVRGQLHSGGWDAKIELDPEDRRRYAYRVDGTPTKRARNYSSLDDDKTQASLRFLMRADAALKFADARIHEAALFALRSLIAAQYPNGGWSQVFSGAANAKTPVVQAGYRADGAYANVKEYWWHYTLNDGLVEDVVDTLLLAHDLYGDAESLAAAKRAGEFLIRAQMPEPQPAWAQQYDREMKPAWARRFEPPSITGGESQDAIVALMTLYEATGEKRFLEPVDRALAYLKKSELPDGRLARFYQLKTNEPLYFNRNYELTHDDGDLPTHYDFKITSKVDKLRRRYENLLARPWKKSLDSSLPDRPSPEAVAQIIQVMDPRGAWVEAGSLRYWGKGDTTDRIIDPVTFARNIRVLARYTGLP